MNSLNQIIVEGNVVRQAEKKYASSGLAICTFPIAVNRHYKTQEGQPTEEVSYFEIDTFSTLADKCALQCSKGRGVRVVGRLKQNRWKDTEGKNHSTVKIVAEHVEFKLQNKKSNECSMLQEAAYATQAEQAMEVTF